jgi:hypothetical protein
MSDVIEDCIVEQPDWNTGEQATLVTAQVMRNCYIRGDRVRPDGSTKPTLKVSSLTAAGSVAALTTYQPHGRVGGDWIVVSGVVKKGGADDGTDDSYFNGAYEVRSATATTLTYDLEGDPTGDDTSEAWLDRITVQRVVITDIDPSSGIVTTASPHYRAPAIDGDTPRDFVQITGVKKSDGSLSTLWNGYFKVEPYNSATHGRVKFKIAPQGAETFIYSNAQVLMNLHQALSGNARIVERNRVWHCAVGVYHDTWTRWDLVVRNNYFHDVAYGVQVALGLEDDLGRAGEASYNGGVVTVEVTTGPFGLREGAIVRITGDPSYDRYFRIRNVKAAEKTFDYDEPGSPPPSSVTIKEKFQSWRVIAEKNVIEQALRMKGAQNHPPPWGIPMGGASFPYYHPDPVLYLQHNLLLRRNLIRPRDGATAPAADPDPDKNPFGIFIDGAQNVVMEGNLINVFNVSSRSMLLSYCDVIKTLNNSRSDGTPLRAQRIQYVPSEAELGHVPDFQDSLEEAILLQGMKKP